MRSLHSSLSHRKPGVERLEDRCLMSATLDANQSYIQALYQDGLVFIYGRFIQGD